MKSKKELFFTDFFGVDSQTLDSYGAYNISLISDSKMFINPILLFFSSIKRQREAHNEMVEYLVLLYTESKEHIGREKLLKLFTFKEPKQNWLGYTHYGNSGHGLFEDFANTLYMKLKKTNLSFGSDSHPEKIFLFGKGHGPDSISDFTVRMILDYLLEYTQEFAEKYLDTSLVKEFRIQKSKFDFKKKKWINKTYRLPCYNHDFVILTPNNILTNGETHINYNEFIDMFDYIVSIQPNREAINDHLSEHMYYKLKNKEEKKKVINEIVEIFPDIVDSYIDNRVANKSEAIDKNDRLIKITKEIQENLISAINRLNEETEFYNIVSRTIKGCIEKANALKSFIEGNIELFSYLKTVENHEVVNFLSKIWYSGNPKKTNTKNDKITFKSSNRSQMKRVLSNSNNLYGVLCYIVISKEDMKKLNIIVNKYNLNNEPNLIIIKAY